MVGQHLADGAFPNYPHQVVVTRVARLSVANHYVSFIDVAHSAKISTV
jgi:hypothetical protein